MQRIMFRCPISTGDVPTGAAADTATFDSDHAAAGSFVCPRCGLVHNWFRSEVWLEATDAPSPS